MLCPGCSRRGASGLLRVWDDSCPAAGLLAFQQNNLSSPQPADRALLRAQLPHSSSCWGGTGPVTSAQPGTDPFPRGLPVFHNHPLCPDPSCRPDRYLRSQPPVLAEGTTLRLPPTSSPPAPPCPYRSLLILLPGCRPAAL